MDDKKKDFDLQTKEHVRVEDKGKVLSKEELLQTPTGTGTVKVGGEEPTVEDSAVILGKAQEILAEHGNQESNISVDSGYWSLMNKYRVLATRERELKARKAEEERNK